MGMKIDQNLTGCIVTGVAGTGAQKTIAHGLGVIPAGVFFCPYTAAAVPFLVSADATNVICQGASDTFDVLIIAGSATPN